MHATNENLMKYEMLFNIRESGSRVHVLVIKSKFIRLQWAFSGAFDGDFID